MTAESTERYEEPNPPSLGLRLRAAREYQDLSVPTLANRVGVEPETIEAWEADERAPRANRLPTLSGILDVTLPWLLEGREDGSLSPRSSSVSDLRRELDGMAQTVAQLATAVEATRRRLDEIETG